MTVASVLLTPIEGGVCAPEGFRANGIRCGICEAAGINDLYGTRTREDAALIAADGLYPTACVFSCSSVVGAPVSVSRRHLKNGKARAVFINGGVANVCGDDAEKTAESVCDAVAARLIISRNEIVIASTGYTAAKFPLQTIVSSVKPLADGLERSHEKSLAAARGIMTTDTTVKQFSFSFVLGNYVCRIGAICKGRNRVAPNMATTLCVLTTDANISSEMLQKALTAVTNETFNMTDLDGVPSPNDTVCIMASGKAGNYRISCADSEYKKFYRALEAVAKEICRKIVEDGSEKQCRCRVDGARSKRTARALAKAIIGAYAIRKSLEEGVLRTDDLLSALGSTGEAFRIRRGRIKIYSEKGALVLFEDGLPLLANDALTRKILDSRVVEISVSLFEGNYAAEAIGGL